MTFQIRKIKNEDIDLPKILYKYRDWGNSIHKEILTKSEVYFAPHNTFGDTHEHNLEYDLTGITEERLYEYFYFMSKEKEKITDEEERKKYAKYWSINTPLKNPRHIKYVNEIHDKRLNDIKGVLSVSPFRDNQNLWTVFANMNSGFCVGLDSNFIFKEGLLDCTAGYVDYYEEDNPPKLKILTTTEEERLSNGILRIFSLPKIFEDEKEFRLSKILFDGKRNYSVEAELYKEVILGAFMPEDSKKEVIEVVKSNFSHCQILQQEIDYTTGKMNFNTVK